MSDPLAKDCARCELRLSVNELLITCQCAENLTAYTRHRFPVEVMRQLECVNLIMPTI